MKKVAVIGSGFAGISAATTLVDKNCEVHVFEKNEEVGGRARQFESSGFVFDMGPSWYWMPDVFESYFNRFGKSSSDYYNLVKLSPSFRIYYGKDNVLDIPEKFEDLCDLFESIESGSSSRLKKFMKEAEFKYETGIRDLVYKPGLSLTEYLDSRVLKGLFRLQIFSSFSRHVRKYFKDERLISLMEFPVLFLGAKPQDTPALYSLMNYAGMVLGTWYPMGGFYKIIEGMRDLAVSKGVIFHTNSPVTAFQFIKNKIDNVSIGSYSQSFDAVVASADYRYVDQTLLPSQYQSYSAGYWDKRVMAPSALIFYIGVKRKVNKLHHHNLFFDEDFQQHAEEIYQSPQWPSKPLFYVCCPSKTDPFVAPEGCENLFLLMPVAPGLKDDETLRDKYFDLMIQRIENMTGENILSDIVYKRSYCINDFTKDYNAFKGNAYGLANTLLQTAVLKPSIRSKKVKNLYYAGQLTVPGPGVPPAIISGQVSANELLKNFKGQLL